MSKVLITGGAGFIGSHLTRLMLKRGYKVTVFDNFSYGNEGLISIKDNKNLKIVEGNICHLDELAEAIEGVETVIALAAIVGDPACALNEKQTYTVNYEATKSLVELCKFYSVRRLVFASSCSVYGASRDGVMLNEGSPLRPVSLYASTRILSEKVVMDASAPLIPVVLRLATVFGVSPRMRFDLVVNWFTARAAHSEPIEVFGGKQWRPNVHVQDAAKAFCMAAEAPDKIVDHEVFNIGGESLNMKISDIAKLVQNEIKGTRIIYKRGHGDQRDYCVNFQKAMTELNYKPKYSLKKGIAELKKLFQSRSIENYLDKKYYNVQYLYKK